MTCVLMSCGNKVRTSVDVDFGKGKFKEPFRGLISSHPQWLVKTLDWPVIRELRPDTVELVKNIEFGFDQGAIASGTCTKLQFHDNTFNGTKLIKVYCDNQLVGGDGYMIKPSARPVLVEVKYKVDPQLKKFKFNGFITCTGATIGSVNGHKIQYSSGEPIVNIEFKHKIGWPLLLWTIWFLIFLLVLAVVVIVIIIIVNIVKQWQWNRAHNLEEVLRQNSLPIKEGILTNDYGNFRDANRQYKYLKDIKKRIELDTTGDNELLLELYNQQLVMFYLFVVPESTSNEVTVALLEHMSSAPNNIELRFPHLNFIMKNNKKDVDNILKKSVNLYNEKVNEAQDIMNRDTKFLFFESTIKGADQLSELQAVATTINEECIGTLKSINEDLIEQLNSVRSMAFMNIRIGIDLLNYMLDCINKSQKGVTRQDQVRSHDSFDIKIDDFSSVSENFNDISGLMVTTGIMGAEAVIGAIFGTGLNPIAIIGFLASRASMLEDLNNSKIKIMEYLNNVSKVLPKLHGASLRCLEIGNALVRANEGFMAIYEPLARKMFIEKNYMPTMADCAMLGEAIKEYNKINKTKL